MRKKRVCRRESSFPGGIARIEDGPAVLLRELGRRAESTSPSVSGLDRSVITANRVFEFLAETGPPSELGTAMLNVMSNLPCGRTPSISPSMRRRDVHVSSADPDLAQMLRTIPNAERPSNVLG